MKESFGQRLARLRKEKGYTQEDIASKITISPQAVSKWENDVSSPDILVLSSLADILGVSVDVLLGREETSKSHSQETSLKDDEGNEVTTSKEGIRLKDNDGGEVLVTSGGKVKVINDPDGKIKEKRAKQRISFIVTSIVFGLSLITYIVLGLTISGAWKVGWLLFFISPIVGSVLNAVFAKRITHFAYPLVAVGVYCLLGFILNGWNTYWFLFITIPAFYLIFGPIDKYVIHHGEKDEDEDDDD